MRERVKTDFALGHVFGIEIHEILARICKINLLLHHDGHTNIEADRSCLDDTFLNPRLNNPDARFSKIVGNPPFGDQVLRNCRYCGRNGSHVPNTPSAARPGLPPIRSSSSPERWG